MLKFYKKSVLKRFIIYPAIIGFLSLYMLDFFTSTEYGKLFVESGPLATFQDSVGINLPFDIMKYYFAYSVGFAYGTISSVIPIRKMGLGIIGLVLMYLKYWMCLTIAGPIAMISIPLELMTIVIVFFLKKCIVYGKTHTSKALC